MRCWMWCRSGLVWTCLPPLQVSRCGRQLQAATCEAIITTQSSLLVSASAHTLAKSPGAQEVQFGQDSFPQYAHGLLLSRRIIAAGPQQAWTHLAASLHQLSPLRLLDWTKTIEYLFIHTKIYNLPNTSESSSLSPPSTQLLLLFSHSTKVALLSSRENTKPCRTCYTKSRLCFEEVTPQSREEEVVGRRRLHQPNERSGEGCTDSTHGRYIPGC
jgi:hypothetical protein